MTLNASVPHFECYVRESFLYDCDETKQGFVRGVAFGVSSLWGRALGWHVMLENGAQIGRLPIHALCSKPGSRKREIADLQLWDCFSYNPAVVEYEFLAGMACIAYLKDRSEVNGQYMFTVDWYGSEFAEGAGDLGWKCAHILELEEGNYAALPNNRILWREPSFITPSGRPDYKTMSHTWKCEDGSKWSTGEGYLYEVETETRGPLPQRNRSRHPRNPRRSRASGPRK